MTITESFRTNLKTILKKITLGKAKNKKSSEQSGRKSMDPQPCQLIKDNPALRLLEILESLRHVLEEAILLIQHLRKLVEATASAQQAFFAHNSAL